MIFLEKETRDKIWVITFLLILFVVIGWKITSWIKPLGNILAQTPDIGSDEFYKNVSLDTGEYTPSEQGDSEASKLQEERDRRVEEAEEECKDAIAQYEDDIDDNDSGMGKFVPVKETDGPLLSLTRQTTVVSNQNKGLLEAICLYSYHMKATQENIEWLEYVTKPEATRQNLKDFDNYKEELYNLINEGGGGEEEETLYVDDLEEFMDEARTVAIITIMNIFEDSRSIWVEDDDIKEAIKKNSLNKLEDLKEKMECSQNAEEMEKFVSGEWDDFDREKLTKLEEAYQNEIGCDKLKLLAFMQRIIEDEMAYQENLREIQYVASGGYRNPCAETINWEDMEACTRTIATRPVSAPRDALATSMPQDPRPMAGSSGVETGQPSATQTVNLEMPGEGTEQRPDYGGPIDGSMPPPGTANDLPEIDDVQSVLNDFDVNNIDMPGETLGDGSQEDILALLDNLGLDVDEGQSAREIRDNNQDVPPVIIKLKKIEEIEITSETKSDYSPTHLGTIMWWSPNAKRCYTNNNWYESYPVLGDIELLIPEGSRSNTNRLVEGKRLATAGMQRIALPLHVNPSILFELRTRFIFTGGSGVDEDFYEQYGNPDNVPVDSEEITRDNYAMQKKFVVDQSLLNQIEEFYEPYDDEENVDLDVFVSIAKTETHQTELSRITTPNTKIGRGASIEEIGNIIWQQLRKNIRKTGKNLEIKKYHFKFPPETERDGSENVESYTFNFETKAEYKIRCTNNAGTTERTFKF